MNNVCDKCGFVGSVGMYGIWREILCVKCRDELYVKCSECGSYVDKERYEEYGCDCEWED